MGTSCSALLLYSHRLLSFSTMVALLPVSNWLGSCQALVEFDSYAMLIVVWNVRGLGLLAKKRHVK